jgi:hypothetical protein
MLDERLSSFYLYRYLVSIYELSTLVHLQIFTLLFVLLQVDTVLSAYGKNTVFGATFGS